MKKASFEALISAKSLIFMAGGGGRTRTYEGIASGFTVRPLCHSGHSPATVGKHAKISVRARLSAGRVYAEGGRGCQPGTMRRPSRSVQRRRKLPFRAPRDTSLTCATAISIPASPGPSESQAKSQGVGQGKSRGPRPRAGLILPAKNGQISGRTSGHISALTSVPSSGAATSAPSRPRAGPRRPARGRGGATSFAPTMPNVPTAPSGRHSRRNPGGRRRATRTGR